MEKQGELAQAKRVRPGVLIYITEDDESIRELVKMALTSFSYEVVAFDNAEDCLKVFEERLPDLAIFDVMLPGISGVEAVKHLRENENYNNLPIILLTAKDSEVDKVVGLDTGADDYITKPFSVMELGARVRSVLRRTSSEPLKPQNDELAVSDFLIDSKTREVRKNNVLLDLTFKEYELFLTLIKDSQRIIPRQELLNKIWGFDFMGESRTLDIHIRTLRQKIGDNADNPKYIKTVRNVGYRFIGGGV